MKLSAQMIDLVIIVIIALGRNRKVLFCKILFVSIPVSLWICNFMSVACFKESCNSNKESLLEATLVASCLHLFHGFISPNSQDLVLVLLAHPRV